MHTMPLTKTALLVIDVQHGLFDGAPNRRRRALALEWPVTLAADAHTFTTRSKSHRRATALASPLKRHP